MMQGNKKYAVMTDEYESINVPGMYFAGQLAHGKDFRRSAGGFIHGFRSVPPPSLSLPRVAFACARRVLTLCFL